MDPILLVQTAVEPYRGIECPPLGSQHKSQFVLEGVGILGGAKISLIFAIGADGLHDTVDHLTHRMLPAFAGYAGLAEVFGNHDVRGQLAPILRDFHVIHLEYYRTVRFANHRTAFDELDRRKGVVALPGEVAGNDHSLSGRLFRQPFDTGILGFPCFRHGDTP